MHKEALRRGYLIDGAAAIDAGIIMNEGSDKDHATKASSGANAALGVLVQKVALNPDLTVPVCLFDIQLTGQATVKAGAAIAAGALVTSDANGKAVTAVAGDFVLGFALTPASAANEMIEVLIDRMKI